MRFTGQGDEATRACTCPLDRRHLSPPGCSETSVESTSGCVMPRVTCKRVIFVFYTFYTRSLLERVVYFICG